MNDLAWLVDHKFVTIDEAAQGRIRLTERAGVIASLNNNEFIVSSRQSDPDHQAISELHAEGYIEYGSTLFATQEADWISYILNNETFDNALALRNKYEHGDPIPDDEHPQNYARFLILFVLAAIKINDEFATHFSIEVAPKLM